ncbi:(2Fe-2S)-binding protein [Domibacillus sp. A3M-37]|uniref:2Fe-2S iron-sulfur cluster-binding protein n=1 Tax=Domibacillus TaxID=1433999 RepID=UPI0006987B16|nr:MULTISPECIES: 2Fe-2S iron-sulfur cluster-binding protein [Domibacillus]MCP3761794.1 (2Fe-2S)-binding protein [Domibacillus sp. A3M-37]
MNKKWTVGSLIPGKETRFIPEKPPVRSVEEKSKKTVMPKQAIVELRQGNTSCSVPALSGTILLDAALKQGCSIQYKCRKGTCGQCAVDIVSGASYLSARNEAEQKKLGSSPRRLACQAIINV